MYIINNCDFIEIPTPENAAIVEETDDEGKNTKQIVCINCSSKILPPSMGTFMVSWGIRRKSSSTV